MTEKEKASWSNLIIILKRNVYGPTGKAHQKDTDWTPG